MMVDHQHLLAARRRGNERSKGVGAIVEGEHEPAAGAREPVEDGRARAIALLQPIGDGNHRRNAEALQPESGERGGGRAVDIIIADDPDPLAGFDRIGKARRDAVEIV